MSRFAPREHPEDNRILDLHLGLLTADEERELLAHVGACALCEDRMRQQGGEMERLASAFRDSPLFAPAHAAPSAVSAAGAASSTLGSARAASSGDPGPSRVREDRPDRSRLLPLRPALWWTALAAAAAAIVLVLLRGGSTGPALELNRLPQAAALVWRADAGEGSIDRRLDAGLAAYQRGDFKTAIRDLGAAEVPPAIEGLRRLYLGNALALTGQETRAVEVLRPVRADQLPEPWSTEARWTLLVAFHRAGRRESADSLRLLLSTLPGEIGRRARSIASR